MGSPARAGAPSRLANATQHRARRTTTHAKWRAARPARSARARRIVSIRRSVCLSHERASLVVRDSAYVGCRRTVDSESPDGRSHFSHDDVSPLWSIARNAPYSRTRGAFRVILPRAFPPRPAMLSRLAPVPAPHLPPVPVLSPHGPKVGPFAHASGSPRTPAPAVVAFACGALSLFLLALVLAPAVVEDQPRGAELVGGGAGSGRRLHQFLAPVWYALPTLFDSIYNLVRARRATTRRRPSLVSILPAQKSVISKKHDARSLLFTVGRGDREPRNPPRGIPHRGRTQCRGRRGGT